MATRPKKAALDRKVMADLIYRRLDSEKARLQEQFGSPGLISSAYIDDLLPAEMAAEIYARFPTPERMMLKRSIKENKLTSAQMDSHDPLIEEAVFAFQDPRIVALIGEITGLMGVMPDPDLYAGGISVMAKGGYLRPHLDNSHDGRQGRYRVLNLLYYVTPQWREEYGGNLQLWDNGPLTTPRTIPSLFNRLVLMVTNKTSWHSVNEIVHDGRRCCVSNYYFSRLSPEQSDYFHATTFRGEKASLGDLVMQADNLARTSILKALPGVYKNPHIYKRGEPVQ
jgi:Rps23 Pro-64 3,4-dihydroxylase Tpa1-like proline 4-hydroxylase